MREQLLTMLKFFDDVKEENKKLKEENEKLKEKLKLSIQVNEELRKENSEIIPELQSKNMIQFQTIHKLQEENEKLKDQLQHKSEVCVALQRLADEEHIRYLDIQVKASEQYPKLKNKIEKQQNKILQLCSEKEKLEEALNKVRRDLSPPR